MTDIDNFVDACRDNNITLARQLLASVDINGGHSGDGSTGLMMAMALNKLPIVRMLLDHPNILVGTTNNYNSTALHDACVHNNEECVRLFLAHQQCTPGIVNTVDSDGNTAEMVATRKGYHGCARIIRDYINNSQASSSFTGASSAVNPALLIPECPCCYESLLEMRPPKQILTCGNGHLICSDCQPEITGNRCISRCGSSYGGRATAMEQMVRQILGIM